MTLQEQVRHFKAFTEKQENILFKKGNDYASNDRLSNFKVAGSICQLTPAQQCLSLIATKVARLGVLLQGKEPNNESIRDSVIDLANYTILLDQILSEVESVTTNDVVKNVTVFDILKKIRFFDDDGEIDVYNIPDVVANWPLTSKRNYTDMDEFLGLENWNILEISEEKLVMSAGGDSQVPCTFTMEPVNGVLQVIECEEGFSENGLTDDEIFQRMK